MSDSNAATEDTKAHARIAIAADEARAAKAFGRKLRTVRKTVQKMTIHELAALSDISAGMLSQIERGQTSPSLRILAKLQTALRLPSDFFFEKEIVPHQNGDDTGDPDYICRADARPTLGFGPDRAGQERLHHGRSHLFRFAILNLPPNESSDPKPLSYPSEKGGYVLEGQLRLTVDGKATLLGPGDSFLFDGLRPHTTYNPGNTMTRVIWIIAKPPSDLEL